MPDGLATGGIIPPATLVYLGDGPDLCELVIPTKAGCQQADTCPAAGLGHWLRHTDKTGQRSTVDNGDGTFWNRACPVQGCTIRVYG